MSFHACERCHVPAAKVNDFGLCLRCWRPATEVHGPESPGEHEKRLRSEAVAEARRLKRHQEREREMLAECVHSFRRRASVANGWVKSARSAEREKSPAAGEFWAHAAEDAARCTLAAADIARRSLPVQARTWLRRAAEWAHMGHWTAFRAASALHKQAEAMQVRLGVVDGAALPMASPAERPALSLVPRGDAS